MEARGALCSCNSTQYVSGTMVAPWESIGIIMAYRAGTPTCTASVTSRVLNQASDLPQFAPSSLTEYSGPLHAVHITELSPLALCVAHLMQRGSIVVQSRYDDCKSFLCPLLDAVYNTHKRSARSTWLRLQPVPVVMYLCKGVRVDVGPYSVLKMALYWPGHARAHLNRGF